MTQGDIRCVDLVLYIYICYIGVEEYKDELIGGEVDCALHGDGGEGSIN